MIRIYSRWIDAKRPYPTIYAFRADSTTGRPLVEVASSAEIFPDRVDLETAGRAWAPEYLDMLELRHDEAAGKFAAALSKIFPGEVAHAAKAARAGIDFGAGAE